jgi:hypothetical protein
MHVENSSDITEKSIQNPGLRRLKSFRTAGDFDAMPRNGGLFDMVK